MTIGIVEVLLTSATISAIISGLMSYFTNGMLQRKSYRNDYYKTIIPKRLEAYENVSRIVAQLKISVIDDKDGKPYHIGLVESPNQLYQTLMSMCLAAMSNIWLSEEMIDKLTTLNKITFLIGMDGNTDKGVAKAKEHYVIISQIRSDIENCIKQDMKDLYKVKKFLKSKTKNKQIFIPYEHPTDSSR